MIFNIQRYSTRDGPGIRTIIFLKDCLLGCRWCQSPKGHARTQNLLYDSRFCLEGCKLCAKAAPEVIECMLNGLLIHREELTPEHLTALADCCLIQALTMRGEMESVEEIMATVSCDKPLYDRSGGGLTLSGGEPSTRPGMVTVLLQASHEAGIHIAVETRLHVPRKYIAPSLPYINLLLADLRHVADVPFRQWTDGNAVRMLDNLKKLAAAGKKITIRVSLIQGFSVDETFMEAITDFVTGELYVSEIHFLSCYTLGTDKYHLLNLPYDAPGKPPDVPELFGFAQQYTCQKGLIVTLRGQQS